MNNKATEVTDDQLLAAAVKLVEVQISANTQAIVADEGHVPAQLTSKKLVDMTISNYLDLRDKLN